MKPKIKHLKLRLAEGTLVALRKDAKKTGRSLNAEINYRIKAMRTSHQFYDIEKTLKRICDHLAVIEEVTGRGYKDLLRGYDETSTH
jgi:hypothetical protein